MVTSQPALPPAPLPRRRRRSQENRLRLFRAALELFAQRGFAHTTVEDITNAADLGKGTFFNYFPSKDHILLAFAEMQLEKLQATVAHLRTNGQSIPQFLRTLGVRMTEEPGRNPSMVRALLLANLSSTPVREAMRVNQARGQEILTEFIAIGQQRGEIRNDLQAHDLATVFRQTVFGTLLIWSLYGDESLATRIHTALEVLSNGLLPRPTPPDPAAPATERAAT
jgi:AcrR family transcriptional regulator